MSDFELISSLEPYQVLIIKNLKVKVQEVPPTDATKTNPSLVLGRNANGKVITITKTISGTSYVKTLTRDANDVLLSVSAWV